MKKTIAALIIAAALLSLPAQAGKTIETIGPDNSQIQYVKKDDGSFIIIVPLEVVKQCDAEGGCSFVSQEHEQATIFRKIIEACGHAI